MRLSHAGGHDPRRGVHRDASPLLCALSRPLRAPRIRAAARRWAATVIVGGSPCPQASALAAATVATQASSQLRHSAWCSACAWHACAQSSQTAAHSAAAAARRGDSLADRRTSAWQTANISDTALAQPAIAVFPEARSRKQCAKQRSPTARQSAAVSEREDAALGSVVGSFDPGGVAHAVALAVAFAASTPAPTRRRSLRCITAEHNAKTMTTLSGWTDFVGHRCHGPRMQSRGNRSGTILACRWTHEDFGVDAPGGFPGNRILG